MCPSQESHKAIVVRCTTEKLDGHAIWMSSTYLVLNLVNLQCAIFKLSSLVSTFASKFWLSVYYIPYGNWQNKIYTQVLRLENLLKQIHSKMFQFQALKQTTFLTVFKFLFAVQPSHI